MFWRSENCILYIILYLETIFGDKIEAFHDENIIVVGNLFILLNLFNLHDLLSVYSFYILNIKSYFFFFVGAIATATHFIILFTSSHFL